MWVSCEIPSKPRSRAGQKLEGSSQSFPKLEAYTGVSLAVHPGAASMSITGQRPVNTAHDDRALRSVESGLIARFGSELPSEVVRATLTHAFDELQRRSSVTTYLPVLAERLAAECLAILAEQRDQR